MSTSAQIRGIQIRHSQSRLAQSRLVEPRSIAARFLRAIGQVFACAYHRQQERRAIHAMTAMSDHMLRDLGIGRSQIVRTVRYGRAETEY